MISLPLDELYLQWLYGQVDEIKERSKSRTHWNIFRLLFKTEFFWLIPNDDNRVEDGRDLRYEFLHDLGLDTVDRTWMELGCSFLEMLIALSRRLAFEAEGTVDQWFWHLLATLDLHFYTDNLQIPEADVEDILNTVIFRTYRKDGVGGLFPLKHPHGVDQTKVEIWHQLNAYLLENDN
jgi:hypothetical protein